ncbi:hypothetical protein SAMN02745900_04431 [Pseudomonas sp. URIL14HWK12:I8]|uniref:hypothetical protein n=1 Tax=unclassified Pseudomonas TaxID=196821 RepID=UPI000486ACCF|nr:MULTISPECIES: hypothetical protein [unclassified Pseudomonas]SNB84446.1 hypothetical protein SAMN02745900_04431 [Pseudomonas sp. URIL14HWK12:I8]
MFARIVVGILIGLAAGIVEGGKLPVSPKTLQILQVLLVIAAIAFVSSSFMFGAAYGVMALAEIAAGYFGYTKLIKGEKIKQ